MDAAADRRTDNGRTLSAVLREICEANDDEPMTIGEIVERFGRRAFGALLFVFAIPNALPLPPGSSTVLCLPILLFAPQVVMGFRRPWLPRFIYDRAVHSKEADRLFGRIIPRLERIERFSRPRLTFLFGPIGDRVIGVVCTFLAIVLIFPIPLGNLAPAIAVGFLGLGMFQRDGLLALAGYGVFILSLGLLVIGAGAVILFIRGVITMLGS